MEDVALIEGLRANESEAWDQFYGRFDELIRAVTCWRKWRFQREVQEDVAQTIRAEVAKAVVSFRGDSSLEYFVKRISVHRCLDEVRRQIRQREHLVPLVRQNGDGDWEEGDITAPRDIDPISEILRAEKTAVLREALATLGENCRMAISRFYVQEMSYQEIAQELGIAINTVGSRLAKCLGKLRDILGRHPVFKRI